MQQNFVEVILELCPLFREYLNVSWSKNSSSDVIDVGKLPEIAVKIKSRKFEILTSSSTAPEKRIYPYEDIMTPD